MTTGSTPPSSPKIKTSFTLESAKEKVRNFGKKLVGQRKAIFTAIKKNYKSFETKMKGLGKITALYTDDQQKEVGQDVANIIKPITENISDIATLTTEEDFKRGFFKSLCGSSLPNNEPNPEDFFFTNPELSMRKDGLTDNIIRDIAPYLQDDVIKGHFVNEFPTEITKTDKTKTTQGEYIANFLLDMNEKITKGNKDARYTKKQPSPIIQDLNNAFANLRKSKEKSDRSNKTLTATLQTAQNSFNTISSRDTVKKNLQELLKINSGISELTVQKLIAHINAISGQHELFSRENTSIIKDFETLNAEIEKKLETINADIAKLQIEVVKPKTTMTSAEYQEYLKNAQKETQDLITTYQNREKQYKEISTFYASFRDFIKEQDTSPKNKTTLNTIDDITNNITMLLDNIPNVVKDLKTKQVELEKLSEDEALRQTIADAKAKLPDILKDGAKKLTGIFDVSKDATEITKLTDAFTKTLKEALKNIPSAEQQAQALQDAVDAIQGTLHPLALTGLYDMLSDKSFTHLKTRFNHGDVLAAFLKTRGNLLSHLSKSKDNTINLKEINDAQHISFLASNGTHHRIIDITKTGENFAIGFHNFPDGSEIGTYRIAPENINKAQTYLNQLLKNERKNTADLDTIDTQFKALASATPPPSTLTLDQKDIQHLFEGYWTLNEADQNTRKATFSTLIQAKLEAAKISDVTKKAEIQKAINHYVKTQNLSPKDKFALHDIAQTDQCTMEIEQRRALLNNIATRTDKKITFDAIDTESFDISALRPSFYVSNDENKLLRISLISQEIKSGVSKRFYIGRASFPQTDKTIKWDAPLIHPSQIEAAEDYINTLYKNESTAFSKTENFKDIIDTLKTFENEKKADTKINVKDLSDALSKENYDVALKEANQIFNIMTPEEIENYLKDHIETLSPQQLNTLMHCQKDEIGNKIKELYPSENKDGDVLDEIREADKVTGYFGNKAKVILTNANFGHGFVLNDENQKQHILSCHHDFKSKKAHIELWKLLHRAEKKPEEYTYTIHDSQIKNAEKYVNDILKDCQTTDFNIKQIETKLKKFQTEFNAKEDPNDIVNNIIAEKIEEHFPNPHTYLEADNTNRKISEKKLLDSILAEIKEKLGENIYDTRNKSSDNTENDRLVEDINTYLWKKDTDIHPVQKHTLHHAIYENTKSVGRTQPEFIATRNAIRENLAANHNKINLETLLNNRPEIRLYFANEKKEKFKIIIHKNDTKQYVFEHHAGFDKFDTDPETDDSKKTLITPPTNLKQANDIANLFYDYEKKESLSPKDIEDIRNMIEKITKPDTIPLDERLKKAGEDGRDITLSDGSKVNITADIKDSKGKITEYSRITLTHKDGTKKEPFIIFDPKIAEDIAKKIEEDINISKTGAYNLIVETLSKNKMTNKSIKTILYERTPNASVFESYWKNNTPPMTEEQSKADPDNKVNDYKSYADTYPDIQKKANERQIAIFNGLFPTYEIFDAYITSELDGEPNIALALNIFAKNQFPEKFTPKKTQAIQILDQTQQTLYNISTGDETTPDFTKVLTKDNDALFLPFHTNPTSSATTGDHYTGALVHRISEEEYKITTINTLRETDYKYTLKGTTNDIHATIDKIYERSILLTNADKRQATNIGDIDKILEIKESIAIKHLPTQKGSSCGVASVNRAIHFLAESLSKKTKEEKPTKKEEGASAEQIEKIIESKVHYFFKNNKTMDNFLKEIAGLAEETNVSQKDIIKYVSKTSNFKDILPMQAVIEHFQSETGEGDKVFRRMAEGRQTFLNINNLFPEGQSKEGKDVALNALFNKTTTDVKTTSDILTCYVSTNTEDDQPARITIEDNRDENNPNYDIKITYFRKNGATKSYTPIERWHSVSKDNIIDILKQLREIDIDQKGSDTIHTTTINAISTYLKGKNKRFEHEYDPIEAESQDNLHKQLMIYKPKIEEIKNRFILDTLEKAPTHIHDAWMKNDLESRESIKSINQIFANNPKLKSYEDWKEYNQNLNISPLIEITAQVALDTRETKGKNPLQQGMEALTEAHRNAHSLLGLHKPLKLENIFKTDPNISVPLFFSDKTGDNKHKSDSEFSGITVSKTKEGYDFTLLGAKASNPEIFKVTELKQANKIFNDLYEKSLIRSKSKPMTLDNLRVIISDNNKIEPSPLSEKQKGYLTDKGFDATNLFVRMSLLVPTESEETPRTKEEIKAEEAKAELAKKAKAQKAKAQKAKKTEEEAKSKIITKATHDFWLKDKKELSNEEKASLNISESDDNISPLAEITAQAILGTPEDNKNNPLQQGMQALATEHKNAPPLLRFTKQLKLDNIFKNDPNISVPLFFSSEAGDGKKHTITSEFSGIIVRKATEGYDFTLLNNANGSDPEIFNIKDNKKANEIFNDLYKKSLIRSESQSLLKSDKIDKKNLTKILNNENKITPPSFSKKQQEYLKGTTFSTTKNLFKKMYFYQEALNIPVTEKPEEKPKTKKTPEEIKAEAEKYNENEELGALSKKIEDTNTTLTKKLNGNKIGLADRILNRFSILPEHKDKSNTALDRIFKKHITYRTYDKKTKNAFDQVTDFLDLYLSNDNNIYQNNPVMQTALMDYGYTHLKMEKYNVTNLVESIKDSRSTERALNRKGLPINDIFIKIQPPQTFFFKTSATDYTAIIITKENDTTHHIHFLDSKQQETFAIQNAQSDEKLKKYIGNIIKDSSEKYVVYTNDPTTHDTMYNQHAKKADAIEKLKESLTGYLGTKELSEGSSLVGNVSTLLNEKKEFTKMKEIDGVMKNSRKNEDFNNLWHDILSRKNSRKDIEDIQNLCNKIWESPERCKQYQTLYPLTDPKEYIIIASLYTDKISVYYYQNENEKNETAYGIRSFIEQRAKTEEEHAKDVPFSDNLFNEENDYSALFITKSESNNLACPFAPILITQNLDNTYNIIMREYDGSFELKNIPQNKIEDLYNIAKNNDVILGNRDEPILKLFNATDKKNYDEDYIYPDSTRMFDNIVRFELRNTINKRQEDIIINNIKESIDKGDKLNISLEIINDILASTNIYLSPHYILSMCHEVLEQEDPKSDDNIASLESIIANREHTKTTTTLETLFPDRPVTAEKPFGIFFTEMDDDPMIQSSFRCYRLQKNTDNYTLTLSQMDQNTQEWTIPNENIENIYNSLKAYDYDIDNPSYIALKSPMEEIEAIPEDIRNPKSQDSPDNIYDFMLSLANPLPTEDEVPNLETVDEEHEPEAEPKERTS